LIEPSNQETAMNWKTMALVLTAAGSSLGIACIEDAYDPWRPKTMSSRSPQPSSEFPAESTVTPSFPFDATPLPLH